MTILERQKKKKTNCEHCSMSDRIKQVKSYELLKKKVKTRRHLH